MICVIILQFFAYDVYYCKESYCIHFSLFYLSWWKCVTNHSDFTLIAYYITITCSKYLNEFIFASCMIYGIHIILILFWWSSQISAKLDFCQPRSYSFLRYLNFVFKPSRYVIFINMDTFWIFIGALLKKRKTESSLIILVLFWRYW